MGSDNLHLHVYYVTPHIDAQKLGMMPAILVTLSMLLTSSKIKNPSVNVMLIKQ